MADPDIERIKRLRPEERIKRLKELGEKRKSEINKIDDLIKSTESEFNSDKIADEIAPQISPVNIDELFDEVSSPSSALDKDSSEDLAEFTGYRALKQFYSDYTELKDIQYASMNGSLDTNHLEAIDQIGERLDKTKYHSASEDVANVLVASKATLYKIRKYAGLE